MATDRRVGERWRGGVAILALAILAVVFAVADTSIVRGAAPPPSATVVPTVAATPDGLAGIWTGGFWLDDDWIFLNLSLERERGRWTGHLTYPYSDEHASLGKVSFEAPALRVKSDHESYTLDFDMALTGSSLVGEVRWEADQERASGALTSGSARIHLQRIVFAEADSFDAFVGDYRVGAEEAPLFVGRSGIHDTFYLACQGRQIGLFPLGGDRYLAATGHELVFERYHDGEVIGFTLTGEGVLPWLVDDGPYRRIAGGGTVTARVVKVGNYRTEEVQFTSGDVTLAGTVVLPHGTGPFPAVVLTQGSGPETRERRRELAATFARQRVAALIYDKRGTGRSGGNWYTASLYELTDDALAGLRFLKPYPEINLEEIGIWGLSQGGWIAPLAGLWAGPEVAFVITVSGAGMSPARQEMYRWRNVLLDLGANPREVDVGLKAVRLQQSLNQLDLPGIDDLFPGLNFDHYAVSVLERMQQPLLAVWGTEDRVVPPWTSAVNFEAALAQGGNADVTLRVFPDSGHSMNVVRGSETASAMTGPWVAYPPGYMDLMVAWVQAQSPATNIETDVDAAVSVFADVTLPPDAARAERERVPSAAAPWYGKAGIQLVAMVGLNLILLSGGIVWMASVIPRLTYGNPIGGLGPRWALMLAAVGALLAVVLLASLIGALVTFFMRDEAALLGYLRSPAVRGTAWLVPLVAAGLVLLAWRAWRQRQGTLGARVHLVLVAVAALALLPLVGYWRLWG